jgi:transposase
MGTTENRPSYDRSKLRYPVDLTDEEWALIRPLIPCAKRAGNKQTKDVRAVFNGIMYIRSTGCQWRYLPKDLPARSTVNAYLRRSDDDRTLNRIHEALRLKCREQAERNAQPTAAIIDSQSVRSVENDEFASICVALMRARGSSARSARLPQPRGLAAAGDHTHGQHPGPRWRRHAHEGAFCCLPHAAHALRRWRISGAWVSWEMKRLCPDIDVEIVKRSDLKKFVVVLKRWLVERRMG